MNKWQWIERRGIIIMVIVLLISFAMPSFSAPLFSAIINEPSLDQKENILIVSKTEGLEYQMLFDVLGESYTIMDKETISDMLNEAPRFVIVPYEVAKTLKSSEVELLVKHVREGSNLLTEGNTLLSRALGIGFKGTKKTINGGVNTRYEDRAIRWPTIESVDEIMPIESSTVLFKDMLAKTTLARRHSFGNGEVLFYVRPIVNSGGELYQYFPYVHEAIEMLLEGAVRLKRNALVTYFDWGYYYSLKPQDVIKKLKENGVQQIHYSGWYDNPDYWQYTSSFIEHAHSYGIRVYLWLELPMVTEAFWNDHPEWRQVTATGEDAKIDWRYLIALENTEALAAVKEYYKNIIERYDWDGVDLAELYFESPEYGVDLAELFTPMSDAFRNRYENKYGLDPIELFDPQSPYYHIFNEEMKNQLIRERQLLLAELNENFLQFFDKEITKKLDVVLTMVDVEVDQQMSSNIGIDTSAFIKLLENYHFTLNIEDPFTLWSLGPDRYRLISENYRKIISEKETLTLDINIVARVDTEVPHSKQTGIEFLNLLWESSQRFDQIAIYASHTPYDNDFRHASYALAHPITFESTSGGIKIVSEDDMFLEVDLQGKRPFVNGLPWPAYNDKGVFLTKGVQYIEQVVSDIIPPIQIVDLTGDVDSILQTEVGVILSYNQKQAMYVGVQSSNINIFIDGLLAKPLIFYNGDHYYIQLPKGQHRIEMEEDVEENVLEIVFEGRVSNDLMELTRMVNGIAMVEAVKAAKYHGGSSSYDSVYKTVTVKLGYYSLWARVGTLIAKANGQDVRLSFYPIQGRGDVLLSLEDFYKALGYSVKKTNNKIIIER